MPFLLVAISFFSFAQFLGSIYSANKKTTMALVTNLVGVFVSLTANILLVVVFKIGILGSAIATVCSYFVLWIIRIKNTGRIVPIKYQRIKMIIAVLVLLIQAVIATLSTSNLVSTIFSSIAFISLLLIFIKDIIGLVKFGLVFINKILKRRGVERFQG